VDLILKSVNEVFEVQNQQHQARLETTRIKRPPHSHVRSYGFQRSNEKDKVWILYESVRKYSIHTFAEPGDSAVRVQGQRRM